MNDGKICISVCAETVNEFIKKMERAAKIADLIELRFDCLNANEFNCNDLKDSERLLSKIFQKNYGKRVILTFRPKEQGGKREVTERERRIFWNSGFDNCGADLEQDIFEDSLYWLYDPKICSHHDFSEVPQNISEIYSKLKETSADIVKLAVKANDATDGLPLMKLLERAKDENKQLIPIAMSEHGVWTRILGLSRGAFMTFAALDDESATAPGQLTAQEMIDVYRVKELDENTEIYGLVAGSTAHSVSPEMHNAAFKFNKLNAVYVPFAVKDLAEFMRRMVSPQTREIDWNLRGFSVTLPHKIEIIKYLDEIDQIAKEIGAVNTVKIIGDKLYGFNSDAAGFIEPLKNSYGDLRGANVALFGAGGAARACVYALKNAHANVTVFARNIEKAKKLADDFDVEIKRITNYEERTTDYDLVVNTTPLGMKKGGLENETILTAEQLSGIGLVYDLVYNPFETKLMQEANKVFVPTLGGLAMLVAQAMEQQKIWTECDAPIKEMSRAALRKLQRES